MSRSNTINSSNSNSNRKPSSKKKSVPLRIIIRLAHTNGTRHSLSPEEGLTAESTLFDVVSRLPSSLLPPLSSGATLVCLRRTAFYDEWATTTLGDILEGDDRRSGVLLMLHVGGNSGNTVMERAAKSLNIKPERMDVTTDNQERRRHDPGAVDSAPGQDVEMDSVQCNNQPNRSEDVPADAEVRCWWITN